jgi:DNA polymerase III sliding clamp (beta) subunit (PCNA family)
VITIADHTLSRLVAQTKPHMGERNDTESVQNISFEYDNGVLYAMATNRFTLARLPHPAH